MIIMWNFHIYAYQWCNCSKLIIDKFKLFYSQSHCSFEKCIYSILFLLQIFKNRARLHIFLTISIKDFKNAIFFLKGGISVNRLLFLIKIIVWYFQIYSFFKMLNANKVWIGVYVFFSVSKREISLSRNNNKKKLKFMV